MRELTINFEGRAYLFRAWDEDEGGRHLGLWLIIGENNKLLTTFWPEPEKEPIGKIDRDHYEALVMLEAHHSQIRKWHKGQSAGFLFHHSIKRWRQKVAITMVSRYIKEGIGSLLHPHEVMILATTLVGIIETSLALKRDDPIFNFKGDEERHKKKIEKLTAFVANLKLAIDGLIPVIAGRYPK